MIGTMDLQQVLRNQEALRVDAAKRRLAGQISSTNGRKDQPRRLFGLRLSLA